MGQKSNTLTLRKHKDNLNSYALNSKAFLNSNEYIETLKRSLEKKGITVTSHFFEATANTFNLSLNLFFKTQKLLKYKKKLTGEKISRKKNYRKFKLKQKRFGTKYQWKKKIKKTGTKKAHKIQKNIKKVKLIEKQTKFLQTFKNLTKNLPTNKLLVHNFKLLNREVPRRVTILIHTNLNYFKRILFSRRFNLYFDFLKMTALLISKKININTYNVILGTIFKFLTKKSHSKFFSFLKKLSYLLIKSSTIEGIKIGINGKLKGKLRAKSFKMAIGKIGTQTVTSEVDFSKVHIHTLYGCFGLQTWIKYKQKK